MTFVVAFAWLASLASGNTSKNKNTASGRARTIRSVIVEKLYRPQRPEQPATGTDLRLYSKFWRRRLDLAHYYCDKQAHQRKWMGHLFCPGSSLNICLGD